MSTDLVKGTKAMLAESGDGNMTKATGVTLFKVGAYGSTAWLAAGLLPFVTLPMLLVIMVLAGGGLYLKGS
jgi:hypothetical protein